MPQEETCDYCGIKTQSYELVETDVKTTICCLAKPCLKKLDDDLAQLEADKASWAEQQYQLYLDAQADEAADRALHNQREGG